MYKEGEMYVVQQLCSYGVFHRGGMGSVPVRVGNGWSRSEWLQRLMVQFSFGAFPLICEN